MAESRCFVQFPHPGREHEPDRFGRKGWNTHYNPHARKFMEFSGRWIEEGGRTRSGNLRAWGEWEAESSLICELSRPYQDSQYPRYLWRPYYVSKDNYEGLHNTDPFIFGDRFLYSNCLQRRGSNPTSMQHLGRGSVIAFGSGKTIAGERRWVLDTVLVVADSVRYTASGVHRKLAGAVPDAFLAVTGGPIADNEDESFRLYRGAIPNEPVEGMFSFFPAMPAKGRTGFPRPLIDLPSEYFNPGSWRAAKGSKDNRTVDELRGLWKSLVAQVRATGLALGTHAALPEQRSDDEDA